MKSVVYFIVDEQYPPGKRCVNKLRSCLSNWRLRSNLSGWICRFSFLCIQWPLPRSFQNPGGAGELMAIFITKCDTATAHDTFNFDVQLVLIYDQVQSRIFHSAWIILSRAFMYWYISETSKSHNLSMNLVAQKADSTLSETKWEVLCCPVVSLMFYINGPLTGYTKLLPFDVK